MWLAGCQPLGQIAPEPVEPRIAHLQEATDIGGFLLVEECRRLGAVAITPRRPVALAFEKSQCDERVEKVVDRPRMKPQPLPDLGTGHRVVAEVAE